MKNALRLTYHAFLVIALALIAGCNRGNGPITPKEASLSNDNASLQKKSQDDDDDDDDDDGAVVAKAVINPTSGNSVTGWVKFSQKHDGVRITAKLKGLSPGKHGFHIHQVGACGNNGLDAGGHFNPEGVSHGSPDHDAEHRHVGDLGNLEADKNGNAHYKRLDEVITLEGPNSILNRSVIVHANEDDLASQPTGNAGGRIACGIIERIK